MVYLSQTQTQTLTIPVSFLAIWCKQNNSWLSFETKRGDRFLVNPAKFFIELPEGSLSAINPRTTFPVINRFPSLVVEDLVVRNQFGSDTYFVAMTIAVNGEHEPQAIPITELSKDPLQNFLGKNQLNAVEHYVLLRSLENGIIQLPDLGSDLESGFGKALLGAGNEKSLGETLIANKHATWEQLLACCLDMKSAAKLDPLRPKTLGAHKEWELTGEMLFALNKINRTYLEYAAKIKSHGSQALGEILTAMGACRKEDIEECLKLQEEIRQPEGSEGSEIAVIGKLLVSRGIVEEEDLLEAIRNQRVGRQSLGRILVSMSACKERDIEESLKAISGGQSFQAEIDDLKLGNYLVKTDTITKTQLDEALRIQTRGRQVLGEMLVSSGLCTNHDIESILAFQREVRESYRSGVEKLGSLLISKSKVPQEKIEEAIKIQSIGRQPFGAILVALGACNTNDVKLVLDIQQKWRSSKMWSADRLGEVLVRQGIITEALLAEPLNEHLKAGKPLGQILIENGLATPEQIIDALLERDYRCKQQFLKFLAEEAKLQQQIEIPNKSSADSSRERTIAWKFASLLEKLFPKK